MGLKSILVFLIFKRIIYLTYCCPINCLECKPKNNCKTCSSGFYLQYDWANKDQCSPCTKPCANCSSENNCSTCMDTTNQTPPLCNCSPGYIMNTSNYLCIKCNHPCATCQTTANHCLTCIDINQTVNESNQCQCNSGFINDNNYNCIPCQNPCSTCSINDTHCDSCKDPNHYINEYFKCICKDQYYSNNVDTCTPCVQPCILCDSKGCLSCIDSNQIINSSQNCICKQGYYEVDSSCQQCIMPCQTCEINQDHCLTCIDINQTQINNQCICNDGYFEVNHICQLCQYPCTKCKLSKDHCLECLDPNHDLINNKCVCKFGFGSSEINNFNCSLCQYPCLDCSISVNNCLSCIDNNIFQLQYGKCVCKQGYFEQGTDCIQCQSQCFTCFEQSDKCLSCSDPNHVLFQNDCQCKPGYFIDNYKNCLKCQLPCLTCMFNQDYCTSCQDKQQLIEGQCICEEGYYIINFNCELCNNNCSKCNSYNECTECVDQYYLYNTQCLKCQIPCLSCFDVLTCKTCSDNYIMDYQGNCIQCIQNCQNCIDSINCIKCYDEFYYNNQSCIPCSNQCQTCEKNSQFCTSCKDSNYILNKNTGICYQINKFGDQYNTIEQILLLQDIRCSENQLLIGNECINQCGNGILNEQYEQCDDGNQFGGDGCSFLCIQEDSYQCKHNVNSPSICSFIQPPDFRLNILSNQQNQTQIIELSFTQKVKILTDLNFEEIAIISIIPQTRININIVNIKSLQTQFENPIYQIKVEFIDPVEDVFLQIEFAQSIIKNEQDLDLLRYYMEINLGNPFILSQQNQQKLTQIVLLNDAIMYSMISISGLALLTGNAIMIFNLIDLLQSLSYIRYMQYNFPPHLIQFLNTYSKVSLKPIMDHLKIDELLIYLNGGTLPLQNLKSSKQTLSNPLNQFYLLNAKGCYFSFWFITNIFNMQTINILKSIIIPQNIISKIQIK